MCGNGWMWGGHGWGMGWLLTAVMLTLFFAVVITGIVVAVRYLRSGVPDGVGRPGAPTAAQDVLAHRFAVGEIDETEFRARITALKEHRS